MRSKVLLGVGLAVGYVLGARAGRKRFDQIARVTRRLWESPRVRKTRIQVEDYARQQAPVVRAKAESIAKATPAAFTDSVRATADAGRTVADRTVTVATDLAGRVTTVAKDVVGMTSTTARDVADRTTGMAKDVADRTTETAEEFRARVSATATELRERGEEARDRVVVKASESPDCVQSPRPRPRRRAVHKLMSIRSRRWGAERRGPLRGVRGMIEPPA